MKKRCIGCQELINGTLDVCPLCGFSKNHDYSDAMFMKPGTILADRYIIGNTLGIGGFGITYRAWDKHLEQKVAIKEYLPSEFSTRIPGHTHITVFSHEKSEQFYSGMTKFIDEAKSLAKFHNVAGVVKIYDSFEANLTAYIIMELLEGETLAKRLEREKTLPAEEALHITCAVLDALNVVHKKGILHRDIAPDNIFLTKDGGVKLIDFGAARYATTSHSRSITVIIKPGYSPEEQYRSRGDQGPYTDVYAVGATLYRMLTGVTPPDALERRACIEARKKDPLARLYGSTGHTDNFFVKALTEVSSFLRKNACTVVSFINKLCGTVSQKIETETVNEAKIHNNVLKVCYRKAVDAVRFAEKWSADCAERLTIGYSISKSQATAIMNSLNIQIQDRTPDGESFLRELNVDQPVERRASRINSTDYLGLSRIRVVSLVSVLLCFAILLAAVSGLFTPKEDYSIAIPDDMTRVPQVVNTEIALAGQALEEAVLIYQIVGNEYSDVIPENLLLNQSISGGSVVNKNSVVELVISVGRQTNTVPNVLGYPLAAASEMLSKLSFAVEVIEQPSSSIAKGSVISQSIPSGNDYPVNETITLYVSSGYASGTEPASGTVTLPNMENLSFKQAMDLAESQGFLISVRSKEYSSVYPENEIISQNPGGETEVAAGSTVNLTVSLGENRIKIPDVVFMSEEDLVAMAADRSLKLVITREYSETVSKGVVIRQLTTAWSWAKPGDELAVVISDGLPPFAMPDLSGMTEAEARQTLLEAGLAIDIAYAQSADVAEGYVLRQEVAPGEPVTAGESITVTVSSGLKLVDVPNVVGKIASEAEKTLKDLGFEVEINRVFSNEVASGKVISQTPNAGTAQTEGTVIYLNVSKGSESATTKKTTKTTTTTTTTTSTTATTKKTYNTTTTTTTTRSYTTTRPTMD